MTSFTACSLFLKERVSLFRWLLVAGGFSGALLIVRPGSTSFTVTLVDGSNLAGLKALAPSGAGRGGGT